MEEYLYPAMEDYRLNVIIDQDRRRAVWLLHFAKVHVGRRAARGE